MCVFVPSHCYYLGHLSSPAESSFRFSSSLGFNSRVPTIGFARLIRIPYRGSFDLNIGEFEDYCCASCVSARVLGRERAMGAGREGRAKVQASLLPTPGGGGRRQFERWGEDSLGPRLSYLIQRIAAWSRPPTGTSRHL